MSNQQRARYSAPEPKTGNRKFMLWRMILLAVAILLILQGIQNGGMQDVLIKAVNICTECIGLG